jgi:hypothetical protein
MEPQTSGNFVHFGEVAQLQARIVSLEEQVDANAWKTSPAMAQAMIDQLVKRNEQQEETITAHDAIKTRLEVRVQELEVMRDGMADSMNALALKYGKEVEELEGLLNEMAEIAPPCRWQQDEVEGDVWVTACGGNFHVEYGRPSDNKMRWCCYCGGKIEEAWQNQPRELAKRQPCGCIICTCWDPVRCHGCGAKHCGTHALGEIPSPEFKDLDTASPSG